MQEQDLFESVDGLLGGSLIEEQEAKFVEVFAVQATTDTDGLFDFKSLSETDAEKMYDQLSSKMQYRSFDGSITGLKEVKLIKGKAGKSSSQWNIVFYKNGQKVLKSKKASDQSEQTEQTDE